MQLHSPFQIRHDLQNFDAKSKLKYWKLVFNDWLNVCCFEKQTGSYYSSHNSKYQLIEIRFEAAKKLKIPL